MKWSNEDRVGLFCSELQGNAQSKRYCKLGCVVRMVVDSILPHAQCGPNDHRNDAPPIIIKTFPLNVRLVFQNEITVRALVESLKIISKRIIC